MKWYTIFCGEDFSDHSVGSVHENFDGEEYSTTSLVGHAKQLAKGKAWLILSSVEIAPDTHEMTSVKLWEHWNPLKKKIVLDPKKGKAKKKKNLETLDQLVMAFQATATAGGAPSPGTATAAGFNIPLMPFEWSSPIPPPIVLDDSPNPPEEF